MKNQINSLVLVAAIVSATAGCAGGVGVGVYGETDDVYYGPDNGAWFSGGRWVDGRRWDNGHGNDHHEQQREYHAPPRGDHGPHLPNAPRPSAPSHVSAPRAPSAPHDGGFHH